jgi:hypothetical protein
MRQQIPLSAFTGVYTDLTNPANALLGFFAQVDVAAIEAVLAGYYSGRGPEGYGAARYLALLLRVKQNIVSDRRLVEDLATNELYRCDIGLDATHRWCPAARRCRPSAPGWAPTASGSCTATSWCARWPPGWANPPCRSCRAIAARA